VLLGVQRRVNAPVAVAAARAMSAAGEHAGAWLGLGALCAVVDGRRRPQWVRATGAVLAAHATSVVLKRVVRRARPTHEGLRVHPGLAGRWGMPSSHAASTTAAAIAFAPLLGTRATFVVPPLMGLSRLVVGAHFPSDVLVGSALGAVTALGLRRIRS